MKIKLVILEKIFNDATAKEIDFLIYAMRFQDNFGRVKGLQSKEICEAIQIHSSYLSVLIRSLDNKGIIEVDWSNENIRYWRFRLVDNIFSANYKEGYINLNTKFLYRKEFLDLKKNEKIIMLNFLARYRVHRDRMTFTLAKLMEWTSCKRRAVKSYIKNLQKLFVNNPFTVTDEKITFHPGVNLFGRLYDETDFYNEHELKTIIQENKAEADEETKKSIVGMYKQFARYGRGIINDAIFTCIKNKSRKLIAPYINKVIQLLYNEYRGHSTTLKENTVY